MREPLYMFRWFTKYLQLRDIFRIHPNTPCHTHDLLECPCKQPNFVENVVSRASSPNSGSDSDSDMDSGFVAASQVKPEQWDRMDKAVRDILDL